MTRRFVIDTNGIITRKWLVVFLPMDLLELDYAYFVYQMPSGYIHTSSGLKEMCAIEMRRMELEEERGLWWSWSVEEKARFNEEVLTPLGYRSGAVSTTEKDIPQEQAVGIAEAGLEEEFGLGEEVMDLFVLDVNFQGTAGGQWVIIYRLADVTRKIPFQNAYAAVIQGETGEIVDLISYEDEW